ncbi:hypothetical protein NONI108955_20705 [Nocardia ninae]|uniref:Uncharacterized protein n=1 Tax=Nocardia ninae NBRC 108245 TaxID=1210091 RepID=A0A511MC93_9NOCA|nr:MULTISPECIES: hypothetical protein [Nocardia]GEM37376.1 hypothetical protein NN4_18950 [Nocardia ninae NBRC 108245]
MPIASAATRQILADAYKAIGASGKAWLGLHSADPGDAGALAELSGGSPVYERVEFTWTSGTGGTISGPPTTVNTPGGPVTHASLWTAKTGGVFIDKCPLNPTQNLGGAGPVTVTPVFTVS